MTEQPSTDQSARVVVAFPKDIRAMTDEEIEEFSWEFARQLQRHLGIEPNA